MNKVILLGNLTKDVEVKYTSAQKAYGRSSIAVKRNFTTREGEQDTDFFDFVCFGKTAESMNKYLGKGRKVLIEGEVRNNKYTDNQGNTRYKTEIVVNAFDFCDKKPENAQQVPQPQPANDFVNITDADQEALPFA